MATQLGIPAATPSHIWNFEETSGDALDLVGSVDLTPNGYGAVPILRNRNASGFGNGAGILTGNKRAIEMQANTNQRWEAGSNNDLDQGLNDSFAFIVVVRAAWENQGEWQIFSKHTGGANPGYLLGLGTAGQFFWRLWGAAGSANSNTLSLHGRGAWHCLIISVNRTTDQMYIRSSYRGYDVDAIGAVTSPSNATTFRVGGGPASGGSLASTRCQIAYCAEFEGAAAEALGDGSAAMAALWTHDDDPNGKISSLEVINNGVMSIIDEQADIGVRIHDWHVKSFPYGYHSPFLHGGKLGLFVPYLGTTQHIVNTDRFTQPTWTKVNIATTASITLMDDSPRDWKEAEQVSATADNGYLYDQFNSVAGRLYCLSIFVKRHSTQGSDVAGRLIFWNASAAGERAGQDFLATDQWKEIRIVTTAAVGQISSQLRVRIDTNGEKISLSRCTATDNTNYPQGCYAGGSVATLNGYQFDGLMPSTEEWFHSDEGEVYILFGTVTNVQEYVAQPFNVRGTANNKDRHYGVINTSEQIGYVIYDDVPAVVANYYTAAVPDLSARHVLRYQWDAGSASLGGFHARTILDGVITNGPAVGWTPDGNELDHFYVGMSYVYTTPLGGFIAGICVYSTPQPL
jgi:hypothetical protein